MTKKGTKKEIKNNQTRDEYTVVLEDIRSQFGVFGEVLGDVKEIVSEHTTRLENVENDMGIVKKELSIIRHNQITRDEFKLLETHVDRLEQIIKK